MIRVAPSRCGYDGYKCVGVPELNPKIRMFDMTCDGPEDRNRTVLGNPGDFDNWYNLPTRFLGFVQTVDHILDMDAELPIVEKDCYEVSVMPNYTDAVVMFMDLYNRIPAYHNMVDASGWGLTDYATVATTLVCSDANACLYEVPVIPQWRKEIDPDTGEEIAVDIGERSAIEGKQCTAFKPPDCIPDVIVTVEQHEQADKCAADWEAAVNKRFEGDGEGVFRPGLMEPMLDVSFSPVGIDVTPMTDTALDGVMVTIAHLTKWRYLIEDYINDFGDVIAYEIDMLFDLIIGINDSVYSDPFTLIKVDGYTLDCSVDHSHTPSYNVSGGSIKVNGINVNVEPLTGIKPPFKVYLNAYLTDYNRDNGGFTGASAALQTSPAGEVSTYLGSVQRLDVGECVFWEVEWNNMPGWGEGGIPLVDLLMPPADGNWSWVIDPATGGWGWQRMKTAKC